MNKKTNRTHLPGEKTVSASIFHKDIRNLKAVTRTGQSLLAKVEESNHNIKQILSGKGLMDTFSQSNTKSHQNHDRNEK